MIRTFNTGVIVEEVVDRECSKEDVIAMFDKAAKEILQEYEVDIIAVREKRRVKEEASKMLLSEQLQKESDISDKIRLPGKKGE